MVEHSHPTALPPDDLNEGFDPANAQLADALRKSFGVLKFIMFVLVVLYFLSGLYSVKPGERGVVYRFGEIVGKGTPSAVKDEGWNWSWPFPIDRWQTVSVQERTLPLRFMLKLTDKEESTGVLDQKFAPLYPDRDDYLLTGDANILHANIEIRYKITDVIDYVTNVHPMPNPRREIGTPEFNFYPEYTVLRNMARNAVIEAAAAHEALDIRGDQQSVFLLAVGRALNDKLDRLDAAGTPLGISVDANSGVIAPQAQVGKLEAIMPPRQTQEVFDNVFKAREKKTAQITKARGEAESLLVRMAGPEYGVIADSIDREYELVRKLSRTQGAPSSDMMEALESRRAATEEVLLAAGGFVRGVLRTARVNKDRVVNEAQADRDTFERVFAEYSRSPTVFKTRLLDDAMAEALSNANITKFFVDTTGQVRIHIPQAGMQAPKEEKAQDEIEKIQQKPKIVRPNARPAQ